VSYEAEGKVLEAMIDCVNHTGFGDGVDSIQRDG